MGVRIPPDAPNWSNMETKICTKCSCNKTTDNFYTRRKTKLSSWCKSCNHEQTLERQRALKKLAVEYKGNKCEDCGIIDNQCIYDFHHIDPNTKDFSVSQLRVTMWSEKIQKELDKCLLLCSNCHRKRHTVK